MVPYAELKVRLARSPFRSRFKLGRKELQIVADHTQEVLQSQCRKLLAERLGDALPRNDGKQTPMHGHPCFIAQHATGCCCRSCLAKWHRIPPGRPLSAAELDFLTAIVMSWIADHSADAGTLPHTPDLFG